MNLGDWSAPPGDRLSEEPGLRGADVGCNRVPQGLLRGPYRKGKTDVMRPGCAGEQKENSRMTSTQQK